MRRNTDTDNAWVSLVETEPVDECLELCLRNLLFCCEQSRAAAQKVDVGVDAPLDGDVGAFDGVFKARRSAERAAAAR